MPGFKCDLLSSGLHSPIITNCAMINLSSNPKFRKSFPCSDNSPLGRGGLGDEYTSILLYPFSGSSKLLFTFSSMRSIFKRFFTG